MIMSISISNGRIGNRSQGQNKSKTNMSKGLKKIYAADLQAMPDYKKVYILYIVQYIYWYWASLSSINGN